MKISVIIATMNRSDDLRVALQSIAKQKLMPLEVLVIDQSGDERTRQLVEGFKTSDPSLSGCLHYFYQEEKSLVKARNRGISLAKGELLSFLDDDVELFDDYYEQVADFLKANPDVGALSGNTLSTDDFHGFNWRFRTVIMRLFLLSDWNGHLTCSGFGHPIYERKIGRVIDVELLPGCNMNYLAKTISGEKFDEWFTGYSYREDVDFSYRISKKTRAVMIPTAKLYHYFSKNNRMDFDRLRRMEAKNNRYIFNKFKRKNFVSLIFFCYSLLGVVMVDFFEFLRSLNQIKYNKFKASLSAFIEILGRAEP